MRTIVVVAVFVALAGGASCGAASQTTAAPAGNSEATTAAKAPPSLYLQFYPFAQYQRSRGAGTHTGSVFLAEKVLPQGGGKSLGLGGYVWANYGVGVNLYELHTNYFLTPEWGAQAGVIRYSGVEGNAYDAFLLYNLSSYRVAPHAKYPWNLRFGIGGYFDRMGGTSNDLTGFLSAALWIRPTFSLNAIYWHVKDFGSSVNWYVLGVGTAF